MDDLPKDKAFLRELLIPTLSSVEKLCAVWDGLNIETQLFIFSQIKGDFEDRYLPARYPNYLLKKIQLKALESSNEFVRYKAAKALYRTCQPSDEEILINKQIDNDSSNLVKYISFEGSKPDGESYFSEPKALRQARFREFTFGMGGDFLATFILSLLDNNLINSEDREDELYYILSEYTQSEKFKEDFRKTLEIDGYLEYSKGKSLGALWTLVPKLPKAAAHILITTLPEKTVMSLDILDGIVNKLSNEQLQELLWRKDIGLESFRKKVFWRGKRPVKEDSFLDNGHEWQAACWTNFTIDDEDFNKLLSLPADEKIERLKTLGDSATTLSLEYYLAIKYTIKELEKNTNKLYDYEDYSLESHIKDRLKVVYDRGEFAESELTKFRLAYLAKKSLSWKSEEDVEIDTYDDRLNFLYIENPKNFWDAYQKISKKWVERPDKPFHYDLPNSLLPKVYDYEEDYLDEEESNMDEAEKTVKEIDKLAHRNLTLNYLKLVIALLILILIFK
jgi:hypothetical protein